MRRQQKNSGARPIRWLFGTEGGLGLLTFLLLAGLVWVAGTQIDSYYTAESRHGFWSDVETWKGVLVEAIGFLFDIALFGILFVWLRSVWDKRDRLRRYTEDAHDFSSWGTKQGVLSAVRAIRRLIDEGGRELHLAFIQLPGCDFMADVNRPAREAAAPADLSGANLNYADLSDGKLQGVKLSRARLVHANLRRAYLVEADLSGANLFKADLSGADLLYANLEGAQLDEAKFDECRWNRQTTWPSDFDAKARGCAPMHA